MIQCLVRLAKVITTAAKKQNVLCFPDKATIIGAVANGCMQEKGCHHKLFCFLFLVIVFVT